LIFYKFVDVSQRVLYLSVRVFYELTNIDVSASFEPQRLKFIHALRAAAAFSASTLGSRSAGSMNSPTLRQSTTTVNSSTQQILILRSRPKKLPPLSKHE
jgi:hypothetical protein